MKKNNNKGFVLAEAIVVGVFILTLFTFLFVNIVPLIGRYDSVKQYDTIDSVYNTNMIKMLLLENNNASSILDLNSDSYTDSNIYAIYSPSGFCSKLSNTNESLHDVDLCEKLLDPTYLDVNTIIITKFRLGKATGNHNGTIKYNLKTNNHFTRAQKEYINSLDNFTEPSNSNYDNYHRVIVEYNDGSFANLEIKQ